MLSEENKAKLHEKSAQLMKILLELREIAPVKFHDTDCNYGCVFNYLGVNYDEKNEEIHIDLAMWSDGLEEFTVLPKNYHVMHNILTRNVILVEGDYELRYIGAFNDIPNHCEVKNCNVIAVAAVESGYIGALDTWENYLWEHHKWENYFSNYIAPDIYDFKAESDEAAVEKFKQLADEERWLSE